MNADVEKAVKLLQRDATAVAEFWATLTELIHNDREKFFQLLKLLGPELVVKLICASSASKNLCYLTDGVAKIVEKEEASAEIIAILHEN